ncbi:MAG: permease [Bdellovibrionaceae bacterium]|nr:permease [Pseudobdellovibrionaceae bacterium]
MGIFKWLNDQLLRMEWLSNLVKLFVDDVMNLDTTTPIGGSVHFFIYDVIKIFILLSVLIFVVSWIQSYFPPERSRKILGQFIGIKANFIGALLGTITPFCSCSSIPLFIGFTSAGLPIGVTFSFLISSPLVDLASIILLASIFNWSIALVYTFIGIILAVIGGTIISKSNMEKYIADFVKKVSATDLPVESLSRKDRLQFAVDQVRDVFQRVWIYVLVGVGIGAGIHNWIPESFIASMLGDQNWWSVPLATLLGAPMYADIFGTLPIAEALIKKGIGIGTVLAFMMSVTALSIPSLILLKKVVKMPLLLMFTGIVTVGIIIIGYILNSISHLLI